MVSQKVSQLEYWLELHFVYLSEILLENLFVGEDVGHSVGCAVGTSVGTFDGDSVGDSVNGMDGRAVGAIDPLQLPQVTLQCACI